MSGHLPDGLSENHPYFNPPREVATAVECGADEALVVPSYAVKVALAELYQLAGGNYKGDGALNRPANHGTIVMAIEKLQGQIDGWEQEAEYECPFNGEIDLEESECARWDCPVCGNERETDNAPEERDPDYDYDHMGEGR